MALKETKRKGFNFFRSYYDVYNELPDKDKIAFIDALLDRQFLGIKPTDLKGMANFAWISQVNSIDSQVKGYEDKTGVKLNPTVGVKKILINPTEQVQVQEKEKEKEKEEVKLQVKDIKENVYSKEIHDCFKDCKDYFPEHLHPKDDNTWLDTIEKLNRIEKIPLETIQSIVKKTRSDDFWSANFLSLTKLRKKNKDGVMYVIVFNEKIKSNEKAGNTTYGGKTSTVSEEYIKRLNDELLS
jgi:hypothetical protein